MFDAKKIKASREAKLAPDAPTDLDAVNADEPVSIEDFVGSKLDEYATYTILNDALHIILGVNDTNKATLSDVLLSMFEPEDDEELEEELMDFLADKIIQLLKYLGVSESTIDDLVDDDSEISEAELIELADYLNEKIGDTDLSHFVMKAMHSGSASMDDAGENGEVDMDWAFSKTQSECKEGKKTGLTCVKGFSNGQSGYWRYPAGQGNKWKGIGNYVARKNLKRNQGRFRELERKAKVLERARNTSHSASANKAFKKSQSMRAKAGMTTFGVSSKKSKKAQD